MKRSFDASFFHPRPAVHAAAARPYPSWFLLDMNARFANYEDNATTAEAKTSTGRTIKFTFCLEPPPAVSHLFVHEDDTHGAVQAEVVSSAKDLVLLCRKPYRELEEDEYFVYRAAAVTGRGRSKPSLTPIPANLTTLSWCAAILPLDDGHFLVADLTVELGHNEDHYNLHVFSSKTWVWSTRALTVPVLTRREDLLDEPAKVIALGGSVLGWVVTRAGIIVCDLLGQDPVHTRFIPLPKPDWHPEEEWKGSLLHLRDVAYCGDGFIRLLDMDIRFRQVTAVTGSGDRRVIKMARDFDRVDTILDSELLLPEDASSAWTGPTRDGWKIRTCYKHISWNYWRKGHVVDSDDIAIYNPRHCAMLPEELWDEDFRRWTLKRLIVYNTTLSIHGGNMVYLTLVPKQGFKDEEKWIVGLDLGKKTVEMFERDHNSECYVQPFMFSQHLNTPPSVEEITHGASMAQSNHVPLGCVTQNNPQPLQQNMWNAHAYNGSSYGYANNAHPGYNYGNNQHSAPWPTNLPQALDGNLNSLGSGCSYPVNAQSMYPSHMVNTATHGQRFYSMPLLPPGPPPALAPSSSFAPSWRPGHMAFRQ